MNDKEQAKDITEKENNDEKSLEIKLYIDDAEVPVTWEDNDSVKAIMEMISDQSLTVQMSMYGGFEQVGSLGMSLPRKDRQITTSAGDIVLYSGDQIVVFYGSNSWSYTRLGHVELSAAEISELLSHGDVAITLSAQ